MNKNKIIKKIKNDFIEYTLKKQMPIHCRILYDNFKGVYVEACWTKDEAWHSCYSEERILDIIENLIGRGILKEEDLLQ